MDTESSRAIPENPYLTVKQLMGQRRSLVHIGEVAGCKLWVEVTGPPEYTAQKAYEAYMILSGMAHVMSQGPKLPPDSSWVSSE